MCGIAGTAGFGSPESLRAMAARLVHRGPDAEGFFDHPDEAIFLANRRLSIIDVEGGDQPVFSEDRNIVAVQNGEIYNYRELRKDLIAQGHRFTSNTDTEVLPHLYEQYGEAFVEHLDGMFAIALWDNAQKKLILARDHAGIKPLYLWKQGGRLAFASEVKALMALDGFEPSMNPQAMHFLLNIRFIPGEQSLFKGVTKLAPGSLCVWQHGELRQRRWWKLSDDVDHSIKRPQDCAPEVLRLLRRAVDKQMVSDVPLGLYLSGGIDSSALVALAAQSRADPVRTFTLGFNEPTDELDDARLVADKFGTDHRESTITMNALEVFPKVTWHTEEPKENAIQLYLLASHAREHVKVALSGLGGDELFGGYRLFEFLRPTLPAHRFISRQMNQRALWPARQMLATALGSLGSMRLDFAQRAFDLGLSAGVPERSYLVLRNMWEHDRRLFEAIYTPAARAQIELGVEEFFTPLFDNEHADVRESVLRAEVQYKMVDDFLMNEDRTSMAASLEVRPPFLDKELMEFAFQIPAHVKFSGGLKSVLKLAMADLLPEHTLRKPKWGFTFDSYHQFQKDLRQIARRELTRETIAAQGIFNYDFIERILNHPPHRWMRWHYFLLWLILGIKLWQDLFIHGQAPQACFSASKTSPPS